MDEPKREPSPQNVWKSQDVELDAEEEKMQFTTEEICRRARGYDRNNLRAHRIAMVVATLLFAGFGVNLLRLGDAKLVGATVCGVVALAYILWRSVRTGVGRMSAAEPCAHFLLRQFEGKRQWARDMRWAVLLLAPALLFGWWGNGLLLRAKGLGIHAQWLLNLLTGSPLLIAMAAVLALLWVLFALEAQRLDREIKKLGHVLAGDLG
jgi:hypothetical protein